jgi:hypothetical protein
MARAEQEVALILKLAAHNASCLIGENHAEN